MKKIIIFLIFTQSVFCLPIDSNIFKYFPLKVGNIWTWYGFAYPYQPPPNERQKILNTRLINNHLYYFSKHDFLQNGTVLTSYSYRRIDSLTGNFYNYDTNNQSECLIDSLNIRKNDSAYSCGGKWYRCVDTSFYNIFNQNFKSKNFYWTNYFEGGDNHIFALGIGRVYDRGYGAQSSWGHNLRGCIINGVLYGDTSLTGINKISSEVPEKFSLSQNYPNPFNPSTKIKFSVASPSPKERAGVRLVIFDALGREVQTLINEQLQPGTYEVEWPAPTGDGSNYSSGIYYYNLTAGDYSKTQKMVLIK